MTFEKTSVAGFEPAFRGMRNPLNSWAKADSVFDDNPIVVGPNDKDLALRLIKAGPEHCKFLRQIIVWVDITGSLYWWKEADTYRAGVEKNSCSTMHKLMARPLSEDDFEHDSMNNEYVRYVIDCLNTSMEAWKCEEDPEVKKEIWRSVIQGLPESYLQKRTCMFSYAALRNIIRQRTGHKLKEWHQFIEWCRTLPESWMLFE